MTHARRSRRRKPAKPSPLERDLLAYLDLVMADPVAAALATHVVLMHRGLVAWQHAATESTVLPRPYRFPGDERPGGVAVGGSVSVSREPDDAMLELVAARLEPGGADPERLDPVRQRLTHRLGELAAWYGQQPGNWVDVAEWEPLATRLGDLIGDQVAANALAMSMLRHARLAYAPDEETQRRRKNARDRWRRLAEWYVRVLDEQPSKGRRDPVGRVAIQSVEGEGERRFG